MDIQKEKKIKQRSPTFQVPFFLYIQNKLLNYWNCINTWIFPRSEQAVQLILLDNCEWAWHLILIYYTDLD